MWGCTWQFGVTVISTDCDTRVRGAVCEEVWKGWRSVPGKNADKGEGLPSQGDNCLPPPPPPPPQGRAGKGCFVWGRRVDWIKRYLVVPSLHTPSLFPTHSPFPPLSPKRGRDGFLFREAQGSRIHRHGEFRRKCGWGVK